MSHIIIKDDFDSYSDWKVKYHGIVPTNLPTNTELATHETKQHSFLNVPISSLSRNNKMRLEV